MLCKPSKSFIVLLVNWLYTHHAIVVFRLQVKAAYYVDSDQAFLRTALRQLPKLSWWV